MNKPEGCGLSLVPFIESRSVLRVPCPTARPRDRPPIPAAVGLLQAAHAEALWFMGIKATTCLHSLSIARGYNSLAGSVRS